MLPAKPWLLAQLQMGKVTPDVEAASTKLAGQLEDPLLRKSFQDWSKLDKLDFYNSISKNLAFSKSGRESLKDFGDGLTGKVDNPYASATLELRESLTGEERDRLDKALGLSTGAGGAGASDTLQGSKPYQDAVNLDDQLQGGDNVGAFGSAAGITSAGLALAGSSLAGPIGAVALGVDVYQALDESSKYSNFVQTGHDCVEAFEPKTGRAEIKLPAVTTPPCLGSSWPSFRCARGELKMTQKPQPFLAARLHRAAPENIWLPASPDDGGDG